MKLYAPTTINEIKNKHGFKLSKSLGQNFLTDKNIIDKIKIYRGAMILDGYDEFDSCVKYMDELIKEIETL